MRQQSPPPVLLVTFFARNDLHTAESAELKRAPRSAAYSYPLGLLKDNPIAKEPNRLLCPRLRTMRTIYEMETLVAKGKKRLSP